jgi:aminocarboxymuconate-semialdehyde decarboxylase
MNAIEIGSHLEEKNLDHQHFWPIYKAAEELDMLIFVHPWDMDSWSGRTSKYWLPWLVGEFSHLSYYSYKKLQMEGR